MEKEKEPTSWTTVVGKKKLENNSNPESNLIFPPGLNIENLKIKSPCWYFNTGGCRNKDGTPKSEENCKYLHVYSPHIQRPHHIAPNKPCDKYNLEGYCKWGDYCKYLHKSLTQEEWETFYPNIPYALKINNQKRQMLDIKISELESKINILEYKIKSMDEYYEQNLKLLKESLN